MDDIVYFKAKELKTQIKRLEDILKPYKYLKENYSLVSPLINHSFMTIGIVKELKRQIFSEQELGLRKELPQELILSNILTEPIELPKECEEEIVKILEEYLEKYKKEYKDL